MTAFIEYAVGREVADLVYRGRGSRPFGWEIDTALNKDGVLAGLPGEINLPNGLYAYALKPIPSNTSVDANVRILAFRGTELTLTKFKDLYTDFTDIGKTQFGSASQVVNQWLAQNLVDGNRVELVGHSLGGALVQWAINNTNLRDTVRDDVISATEIVRSITGNPNLEINPSQLHFNTFNAPGITNVLGGFASDRTTVVSGEHHVIVADIPFVQGDVVHLVGGAPIGGVLVGHKVDFKKLGDSAFFAHSINKTDWWDTIKSPVVPYEPFVYPDLAIAQSIAANYSRLANTDGTVEGDLEAAARVALFLIASGVALGTNTAALATELGGFSFNRDSFANTLAAGVDGINRGLTALTGLANSAGKNVAEFGARLSSGYLSILSGAQTTAAQTSGFISNRLFPFLRDTAKGVGNAFSDFVNKAADAVFDLGRTITNFLDLDPYSRAFGAALRDPAMDPSLKTAIRKAQDIVESAGQTVVLDAERPATNPFDTPGFDPDAASLPSEQVREGGIKRFTLSLPYGAGEGGQRIAIALDGTAASNVRLLANAEEVVPQDGVYTLTVARGERELEVGLLGAFGITEAGLTEPGALSLSATLVDSAGQATHQTHVEANKVNGVRSTFLRLAR